MKSSGFRISLLSAGVLFISASTQSQSLQDAMKLTVNEQFEQADKAFKSLISSQPTVGNTYFYKGENFFNWGKTDSAQNTFQKGISMNAMEPLNYVGLAKIQLINGDSKSATDNIYKAKTLSKGKDPLVLSKIAEAYIAGAAKDPLTASDLLKQAVDLLKEAIEMDKKNANYHIDLGDAYLAQHPSDGSVSIDEYNEAITLDPKNVIAMLHLGKLWENAQQATNAYDYFTKAIKLDSTFAPAYREEAELLKNISKIDEAIAAYKKYLKINNSLTGRARYGSFLFLAKKYDDAIIELQNVLSQDSSNIVLYRLLGYSQFEKKDYKNGLINMNKFFAKSKAAQIKILGSDYSYLGKLLSKNGQDSLAIVTLKQAVTVINNESSADVQDIYLLIAQLYSNDQNYPMAIVYFKKRIKAKTQVDVNDYYYLGQTQMKNNQPQAADSSYLMITQTMPDLLLGYQLRARANGAIDSTQTTAKPIWEQYIQKVGTDTIKNKTGLIEAYLQLGYYYYEKADKENATINYKKVLALDPDNANAKAYFESLKPRPVPKPKTEGKK